MNILQLCPRIPYPLHDGGAIGIYNITKHLSHRGHNVRMVTLSNTTNPIPDELKKICHVSPVLTQSGQGHSYANVLRSWFSGMPYSIFKYQDRAVYEAIEHEVRTNHFDVVHADHLAMAPYAIFLKKKFGLPIVLREHNMETIFLERLKDSHKNSLVGIYSMIESQRMRNYEPKICEEFDACAMITQNDEQYLNSLSQRAQTMVIPAGVDIPENITELSGESNEVMFLASLDWKPNQDGFMWFYDKVLPLVLQEIPDAIITIVGRGENNSLKFLSHPNLKYIGFVEVLQPYIRRAKICIVPLFVAGGMRIKILELMAHQKAIVSTSIGAEGIQAVANTEICIANTAEEFAQSIIRLYLNKKEREEIGRAAQKKVAMHYSWTSVAEQFETLYNQVINR